MTGKQYLAALKALGLSQRSGAKFLGVNERTSRRWATDGPSWEPVAILLRFMLRDGRTPQDIRPEWHHEPASSTRAR